MNELTNDCIAIDTNIFEQLLNPQNNTGDHITRILEVLTRYKIKLLVDNGDRIKKEYQNRIKPLILRQLENPMHRVVLQYSLAPENYEKKAINGGDDLMRTIRNIMPVREGVDKIFVYLILKNGKVLITNDRADIIDDGVKKDERRRNLLTISKRAGRKNGAQILTSKEAERCL